MLTPGWNTREFFEFAAPADVAAALRDGADPDAADRDGRTPLHHAAVHGNGEMAAMLIGAGARQRADRFGWWPLHCAAAAAGRPDAIAPLLDAGAGTDVRTGRGITPLHFAAMHGTHGSVRALLAAGADPAVVDAAGRTPLGCALEAGHREAALLLRDSLRLRRRRC